MESNKRPLSFNKWWKGIHPNACLLCVSRLKEMWGARGAADACRVHPPGCAVSATLLCCFINGPRLRPQWHREGRYTLQNMPNSPKNALNKEHLIDRTVIRWLCMLLGNCNWCHYKVAGKIKSKHLTTWYVTDVTTKCNLSSVSLFAAQGSQGLPEEMESMMESSGPRLRRCGYCLLQVNIRVGGQWYDISVFNN